MTQGQRIGQWNINKIRSQEAVISAKLKKSDFPIKKSEMNVSHHQQRIKLEKSRVLNPRKVRSVESHPSLYLKDLDQAGG